MTAYQRGAGRVGGQFSRRSILRGASLAASGLALAPFVRARSQEGDGGALTTRLKLAAIGVGNRGAANLAGVLSEDVAFVCDVDSSMLARGVDQVVRAGKPRPKTYVDWRELLNQETDLDGIVISTPDHTHAAIARAALSRAKPLPVYCEKPLTRTVAEAQELRRLAGAAGVATQMGTQIHSQDNYRRVVEALRGEAIGKVSRVDVVSSKSWSGGSFVGKDGPDQNTVSRAPATLNWDLWLGPTPSRPYSEGVHPAHWRRFWAFGNGTVGDMAAHWLDLVHWALELDPPKAINVEGPEVDPVGTPAWMHASWLHGSRVTGDQVEVHWWDGGKQPAPEVVDVPLSDCHVFQGDKGRLISTYNSFRVELDDPTEEPWTPPEPWIRSSPGHYAEWLNRIRSADAPSPTCHFDYAAPLTETILLATVAYRSGGSMTWNADGDSNVGQDLLAAEEREGWKL